MLVKPISEYVHSYITKRLTEYDIKTVLDIGGKGKMKGRGFSVTNADIKYGIDGRKLPFKDNSFDATMSINTLEHVGNDVDHVLFLREAQRVAKIVSIHYFPINFEAEAFLKKIGHNHPCFIPCEDGIKTLWVGKYLRKYMLTVRDHFLLLATMYPKLNVPELYTYISKYGYETFSVLVEIIK